MSEPEDQDQENPEAPPKLIEAFQGLHKERIFVPGAVDDAVLRKARQHLSQIEPPQFGRRPWVSWAAMAACLALAAWVAQHLANRPGDGTFVREDINHDGRVDILDAFTLARKLESGGTLDPRWDINGDGRIDRADVNAIAARAVSLGRVVAYDARLWNERRGEDYKSGPPCVGSCSKADGPRTRENPS